MSSSLSSFLLTHICTSIFAGPLYIAYVSVTLIGSVIIDNQSILTLIEAWLTVARDSLYHAETVYYKCNIPVRGKSELIILKLEDMTVLRRSPDLLNNVKIGQDQLRLIMKHILFYGGYGHFG